MTDNQKQVTDIVNSFDSAMTKGGVCELLKEATGTSLLEWSAQAAAMVSGKEAEAVGMLLQMVFFIRHDKWAGCDGYRNSVLAKTIDLSYTLIRDKFMASAKEAIDDIH